MWTEAEHVKVFDLKRFQLSLSAKKVEAEKRFSISTFSALKLS
jgi:hypothetical protein